MSNFIDWSLLYYVERWAYAKWCWVYLMQPV